MDKEKIEEKKSIEQILKVSLFGILIRLILNAFANFFSISESMHTIFVDASLDVLLSVISLFVLNLLRKKATTNYPYGYGKVEYIWNFVQGIMLFGVNLFLAIESCLHFFNPKTQKMDSDSAYLMLASAILTALICIVEYRGWKKTQSSLIYGNYLNHLTDVFVYIIGGFGVWAANNGFQNLDWIIAVIIASIVGYEGIKLCWQAICALCDRSLMPEQLNILKEDLFKELCFPLGWDCQFLKSRSGGNIQFLEVGLKVPGNLELKQILTHLELIKSLWKKKFSGLKPIFSLHLMETSQENVKDSIFKQ